MSTTMCCFRLKQRHFLTGKNVSQKPDEGSEVRKLSEEMESENEARMQITEDRWS